MKISALILACLLPFALAGTGHAAPKAPAAEVENKLAQALELDQHLDSTLRELALDAGRTISFTLAAGKGLRTGELEKLLAAYEAALVSQPDNPLAAAGKARVLSALGRNTQAMAAYESALRLDPADKRLMAELQALKLRQAVKVKFTVSQAREREYWPWYGRHIYETKDTTYQTQMESPILEGLRMGFGYLWGGLVQKSLVYGDNDFDLKRRGYFLLSEWQPRPDLQVNLRLRRELFSADNQNSYFKMPGDQELITGHFLAQYTQGPWWINASYSRERDTWPEVDPSSGRGVLRVKAQELAGLAMGQALGRDWELVGSVFYEVYASPRPDQFNLNAQVIHRPSWLPGLRLALGAGHYTEEAENLTNMLVGYQVKLGETLAFDFSHQFEYASNERSWLSQADALLSWRPWPWLGLTAVGSYGREHQSDRDEYWAMELGIEVRW